MQKPAKSLRAKSLFLLAPRNPDSILVDFVKSFCFFGMAERGGFEPPVEVLAPTTV